jgi:hypothetical protein
MAPIGVQLVKYVLYLLGGTGWPGLISRPCDRRGLGDENPPWLWPPSRGPQGNGGQRCEKDNGYRDPRCHLVPHGVPPMDRPALPPGYGEELAFAYVDELARDDAVGRARISALARTTSGSRGSIGGSSGQERSRRILGLSMRMRFISPPSPMPRIR